MKPTIPMLLVISMAVAGAMMGGSGFNDLVGVNKTPGLSEQTENLEQQSGQYSADRSSDGGSSYLGMTIDSTGALVSMLSWSLALPVALINVGFPGWFALPIGVPIQFVNYVGIWQIVRGMNIK